MSDTVNHATALLWLIEAVQGVAFLLFYFVWRRRMNSLAQDFHTVANASPVGHEERLVDVEEWRGSTQARLDRGDARFDSIDGQLVDLRREVQGLPTLLAQLTAAQTKDVKESISTHFGTLVSTQQGFAGELRTIREILDKRDGLIPGDS